MGQIFKLQINVIVYQRNTFLDKSLHFLTSQAYHLRFPSDLVMHVYLCLTSHAEETLTFTQQLIQVLHSGKYDLHTLIALPQSFFISPNRSTPEEVFASVEKLPVHLCKEPFICVLLAKTTLSVDSKFSFLFDSWAVYVDNCLEIHLDL